MFNRGKRFEAKVRTEFARMCSEFPSRVRMRYQPRLEQPYGVAIPDFEITFDLGPTVMTVLVECQHRVRSGPDVAYKIRAIKSASDRNIFLYIHGSAISPALQRALAADGVEAFSFKQLKEWLSRMRELVQHAEKLPRMTPDKVAPPVLHLQRNISSGRDSPEPPAVTSGRDTIASVLPSHELGAGEFFPFSCVIELSSAPQCDPRQLHVAGLPHLTTARTAGDNEYEWHSADPGASLLRHELTHFFQGMASPLLFEGAMDRRFIYTSILDFLVGEARLHGSAKYPWALDVQPKWTSYGATWRLDPMLNLSTMHLLEALAIYHEFMHPHSAIAQDGLVFAVQALKNRQVHDGLYDRMLGSFVWDFREDYYALFPLVAWTSLLPFHIREDVDQNNRASTIRQFLDLNEFLYTDRRLAKAVVRLAEDRSRSGRIRLWAEWRDILERKLKLKFASREDDIERISAIADHVAQATPNASHRWQILPHLAHLEALPRSVDELMPFLIGLFVDDDYSRLLDVAGWPTIVVRNGPLDGRLHVGGKFWYEGVDALKLAGWQQSWHLLDGFISAALGQGPDNQCPHTACPLHRGGLCASWRPFPVTWNECEFPGRFEKVTGISPDAFRRLSGSIAGELTYSSESGGLSATRSASPS